MKVFAIPVKIWAINLREKTLTNLLLCSDTTLGSCHSQMAHPYRLPRCSLNHQQRRFYHSTDDHDINTVSVTLCYSRLIVNYGVSGHISSNVTKPCRCIELLTIYRKTYLQQWWLELQLIILLTWICLHFRSITR